MQLTDSELRFGLFADAREKKGKKISPAPETIQSLSLLLVGRDESLLSWKVGHSVQACWAFTHNIHRVLHHSTKHWVGNNVMLVSFRVTCIKLKEKTTESPSGQLQTDFMPGLQLTLCSSSRLAIYQKVMENVKHVGKKFKSWTVINSG